MDINAIRDRLGKNFPFLANKPSPINTTSHDTPAGLVIKPEGGRSATTLNKKPIFLAMAGLGILSAGVYTVYTLSVHSKHGVVVLAQADTNHAIKANISIPAQPVPGMPVAPNTTSDVPVAPGTTGKVSGLVAKNAGQPRATATATQQPPTAQQTAVISALNTVSNGAGWSNAGATQVAQKNGYAQGAPSPAVPPATTTAISASNEQSGMGVYDTHLVRRGVSPFEVMQGSVIQATLTTGINSDLSGQIMAIVSRNIYDSASGSTLLIPAGAQLVGNYATNVLPGQSSVAVAWTRIVYANGTYLNLGTMPGTDPDGMSGLEGDVNNHTWLIFKNALLLSIVSTAMADAQPQQQSMYGAPTQSQLFTQQFSQTFGQAEAQLLQRYANIAPTIHVQPGAQLSVVVSKDLVFPGAYDPAMQTVVDTQTRVSAPPAMLNPYQPSITRN